MFRHGFSAGLFRQSSKLKSDNNISLTLPSPKKHLRITEYAERLLEGLKDLETLPRIRIEQENWIKLNQFSCVMACAS